MSLHLIHIPYRWVMRAYQDAEGKAAQDNAEFAMRTVSPRSPDDVVTVPASLLPMVTLRAICADEMERKNRLQVMPTSIPMLGAILTDISRMQVGQKWAVGRVALDEIPGYSHNNAYWTPEDRVIENVIGGSYCLSYRRDPQTGDVTFERHADTGRRHYMSPDRR